MKFTNWKQRTRRALGGSLVNLALLAGTMVNGQAAPAYDSGRRGGGYAGKNHRYRVDEALAPMAPGGDLLRDSCERFDGNEAEDVLHIIKGHLHVAGAAADDRTDRTGTPRPASDEELEIQQGDVAATPMHGSPAWLDFTSVLSFSGTIAFDQYVAGSGPNPQFRVDDTAYYLKVEHNLDTWSDRTIGGFPFLMLSTVDAAITLSFTNGETFDPENIYLYGYESATINISTDLGGPITVSTASYTVVDVDLSSLPAGSSKLYITPQSATTGFAIGEFAVSNLQFDNNAPVILSAATATFAENGTGTVLDVNAHNGDGGSTDEDITYSLTGDDAAFFNIEAATGVITFVSAPDYENPLDVGTDNSYNITVVADDGLPQNNSTDQDIVITVTDVDDTAPTVVSFSPTDNATDVALHASLQITFSETMAAGTGNILIQQASDNSTVQTIAVTDATQVSIADNIVTITPASELPEHEDLYITLPAGTLTDAAGNPYAGIADATTWNFTTLTQTKITVNDPVVTEGNSGTTTLTYTVSLSQPAPAGGATVDYATAAGTATEGSDYTATTGTLTLAAGETSQTVNVTIMGDETVEADETLTLTLSNATGSAVEITDDTGTGTLTNDDSATVTIAEVVGFEYEGTFTATATLDHAVQGGFTVDVNTITGTAMGNNDYNTVSGKTLTFTGTAGETQSFTITVIDDTTPETNETFTVSMSNLSTTLPVTLGAAAEVTILDDDVSHISLADATLTEGDAGTANLTFTVTMDIASTGTIQVDYATADGTAEAGTDYTATTGTLTLAAGETSKTVDVTITGDEILEADETFTLTLSNLTSVTAASLSTATGTGTLTNDDAAAVTIADVSGAEDGGPITVTATLDYAVQDGFTVTVNTSDGTATVSDNDYTAVSGATLTFSGTAGETQTFTLTPTADTNVEADETLTVSLSTLGATTLPVDITTAATITLTNDDSATVTLADVSGDEDAGALTVTATLDHAVQGGFTVAVSTTDGTATAGTDYTAVSGETLTFGGTAGETQTLTVTPLADAMAEADETLTVSLSTLGGTTLTVDITTTATVTLVNDDHAPEITSGQVFTITAAAAAGTTVGTITATDADGDALQDWTLTAGNTDLDNDGNLPFTLSHGQLVVNDADDLATAVTRFTLTVTVSDGTNTSAATTVTVTTEKLTQTIAFDAIANQPLTNGSVTLTATGGASGNPVTYTMTTSPTSGVAALNGEVITLLGPGTVTVTAHQAGNDVYEAAADVTHTFAINAVTLLVPTLFTPNGDGSNDRFIIRGGGDVATITLAIYDRAGNEVYRSSQWNELADTGWDGTRQGKEQPPGAYVWVVSGTLTNGATLTMNGQKTGVIRLLR